MGSQAVSSGNNIAMGQGQFKTINQEFTNWIQPSAVAKWKAYKGSSLISYIYRMLELCSNLSPDLKEAEEQKINLNSRC